jgi:hypothetical protein
MSKEDLLMQPIMQPVPSEIRIWIDGGVIHASIPRTVVRAPVLIDHRRDSEARPIGNRELYDLALNVLNVLVPWQNGAEGESEPVKCFRGYCSAFAARYHCDFARDFLLALRREGTAIETGKIQSWIEARRQLAAEELLETESYLEALSA